MAKIEMCRALKTFSGEEGRVRKGDVFVVDGKPVEGLIKITRVRFNALHKRNLVEPTTVAAATSPGGKTDPGRKDKSDPAPPNKVEPSPAKKKPAADARAAARAGSRKRGLPAASDLSGGLSGTQKPASSSEADPAPANSDQTSAAPAASTGKPAGKRGERRASDSSQSTTPTDSSPKSTASTPATSPGGKSTKKAAEAEPGLD